MTRVMLDSNTSCRKLALVDALRRVSGARLLATFVLPDSMNGFDRGVREHCMAGSQEHVSDYP